MNVLILTVEKHEVEEEADQEGEVREVPLVRVGGPNLVTKTLALGRKQFD